jgi:hypothetical protein
MFVFLLRLIRFAYPFWVRCISWPLEMRALETNVLDQAESELEQIFERMGRNCEGALELFRHVNLEELSPQDREYICGQIHTLREMARILSRDFEKKLTVQVAKQGRALSRDEVQTLLYGLEKF